MAPRACPNPRLMDMTRIERPATPNTFLAGPEGMRPDAGRGDRGTEICSAPVLYEKVRVLFGGQPRTYVAAEFPDQRQIHYVVRSAMLNFPDLVTVRSNARRGSQHAGDLVAQRLRTKRFRREPGPNDVLARRPATVQPEMIRPWKLLALF
jgi:hypothetical protein